MADELERIYLQHQQAFFTLALTITRNRELAEDAVHEAFARLCSRFRSVSTVDAADGSQADGGIGWPASRANEGDRPSDLVSYAFASVRNAAVDQIRRRGRLMVFDSSLFDGLGLVQNVDSGHGEIQNPSQLLAARSAVVESAQQTEQAELLAAAIDALDDSSREIVVLRIWAGMTCEAIGQTLQISAKTVETKYRRALLRLSSLLKGLS